MGDIIKMRGVLARPGTYEKNGQKYIKTAEELKDAAFRFPIIPLTFGHTNSSEPPTREQQIGTVSQKWNDALQLVESEYWVPKDRMPEVLLDKINNGERVPVSAWYLADSMDEDGTLRGISYAHASLLHGEDPICPITECGAFVLIESKDDRLIFLEHADDIIPVEESDEETEASPEAEPEPDEEQVEEVSEEPKPEAPAEQKPEEPDEEEPAKEVELVPETPIPIEAPPQTQKPFEMVDGKYVFVPPIFRKQEKKK